MLLDSCFAGAPADRKDFYYPIHVHMHALCQSHQNPGPRKLLIKRLRRYTGIPDT